MSREYRASIERMNAPYRGVSSRQDAVNFELATLHDLFHLRKVSGGMVNHKGHQNYIQNNLGGIFIGETDVKTSAHTAGTMLSRLGEVEDSNNLKGWSAVNGASVIENNFNYLVSTTGLQTQAGFTKTVTVNPGDIIQIRFKVRTIEESGTQMAVGAVNFSSDGDELDVLPLAAFKGGKYVEKRLYCTSRQDIKIVVYPAYETTQGTKVSLFISDFSVDWLSEVSVGVNGLEHTVKPSLEVASQTLNYIDEQSKKKGGSL